MMFVDCDSLGLKQAPRAQSDKFHWMLLQHEFFLFWLDLLLEFKQRKYDPSMFLRQTDKSIIILVYDDDIIITDTNSNNICQL